jgi:hypothetical protein
VACRCAEGVTAQNQGAQASGENSFNHSANRPKGTKFRSQPKLLFYYIKQCLTCYNIIRFVTEGGPILRSISVK